MIGLAGSYTVTVQAANVFTVDSVTVSASGATLSLLGTIKLAGTLATLSVQSGTVLASGAIQGGTIAVSGGMFSVVGNLAYAGAFTDSGGTLSIAAAKTLTLSGAVTLTGGDVTGPGTLSTTGATTLSGATNLDGGLAWTNSGTVTDSSYSYIGSNGATTVAFTNAATGVFNFTSDVYAFYEYSGSTSTFANAGLLTKTAGTGTSNVYAAVSNAGTITASSGTLELDAGGTLGGTIGATGTGVVALGVGTFTLAGATQKITGALALNGGTLSIGTGDTLTLAGPVTLTGGDIAGPGTLSTSGATTLSSTTYLDGGLTWTNSGTVTDGSYSYVGSNGATTVAFTNAATGVFTFTSDVYAFYEYSGSTSTFADGGLLTKTAGTGTSNVYAAVSNTGTIAVTSGTLELDAGGTLGGTIGATGTGALALGGGAFALASTLTLLQGGALIVSGGTVALGANLSYAGAFTDSGGTLSIASAKTLALSGPVSLTGGDVTGPGTLSTIGATNLSSTTYLDGGLTWTNSGTVTDGSYSYVGSNGATTVAFTNAATGVFNFTSDVYAFYEYSGSTSTFANAGLLAKTAGTGTSNVYAAVSNTGTIAVTSGTLELDAGGTLGGLLTGSGTLALGGSFSLTATTASVGGIIVYGTLNAGALAYGGSVTVSGTLNLAATTYSLSGTVNAEGPAYVNLASGTILRLTGSDTLDSYFSGAGSTIVTTGTVTCDARPWFGPGMTWQNSGTVLISNGSIVAHSQSVSGGSVAFVNQSGGRFAFLDDNSGVSSGNGTTVSIANAGTLVKTGGTGTSHIYAPVTDTGTIGATSGTLEFDGGGAFSGRVTGPGVVALIGAVSVGTLTLAGGAALTNAGTIDQTGAVAIGDTTSSAATLTNAAGAFYRIDNNAGIARGTATASSFVNLGTLTKIGGTATSTISVGIANSGLIAVSTATLALKGAVSGTGAMLIGAGAALDLGGAVAGGQTVSFGGLTGALFVDSLTFMAATINGFGVGETLDVTGATITKVSVNTADQLVMMNGATTLGQFQLSGNHSGDTFSLVADGKGGTRVLITKSVTSWTGTTGDWLSQSGWSAGVPAIGFDANVALGGTYTLTLGYGETGNVRTLTVSGPAATVAINGTLNVASALSVTAGTLALAGTISGGTMTAASGAIQYNSGTLSNVAYWGTLDLSPNYSYLTDGGGLTLAGAGGTGAGTVQLTGYGSYLYVANSDTLNNATINIGNANTQSTLFLSNSGVTLALGASLTLQHVGTYAQIYDPYSGDLIINNGTINAGLSGGQFTISSGFFTNQGAISVTNGDSLSATGATLSNAGLITVSGGTLSLGSWANTGTISLSTGALSLGTSNSGAWTSVGAVKATGGTLDLGGSFTAAQLAAISIANTSVAITGTLTNTGGTLTVGASTSLGAVGLSGAIAGGVIVDAAGGGLVANSGTLSNVAYWGTLDLSPNSSYLTDAGGLTLTGAGGTGPGTVQLTGYGSYLYVANSDTLNNATINIGNANTQSNLFLYGSGVTLTLGSSLSLQHVGTYAQIYDPYSGAVINKGTINAGLSGGQFDISYGAFTNQGTIIVTNGDSLDLSSTTLTNLPGATLTGGVYSVGAGSILQLASGATIATDAASITLDGFGSVIESYNSGTQVAIDSTLASIATGGTLALLDGRAFTAVANSGSFTDSGLLLLGNCTFGATSLTVKGGAISGAGTITGKIAVSGSATARLGPLTLAGSLSGTGTLTIAAGATVSLAAGGKLTGGVADSGTLALTGSTLTATSLTVGAAGVLTGYGAFAGTLTDTGLIDATGGTLSVAGLTKLTAGTWSGAAIEADSASTLQLASNATISTNAGAIILSGIGSIIQSLNTTTAKQVSLDSTLATIAIGGTLALLNGRVFTAVASAGTFTDSGTILLSGGGFSATKLALSAGAVISGSGTLTAPIAVTGAASLTSGTLTLAGSVTGAGTISIIAETLLIAGATFSAATSVTATGSISGFGGLSGTLTNLGWIDATGGTLSVSGLTGLGTGTLSAGQIEADASSVLQLAANLSITTIAGGVTLSGAGSVIESLNTTTSQQVALDSTLATIAATGTLALLSGRTLTVAANSGTLAVAGVLNVNGGTLNATRLSVAATGAFLDNGGFVGAITNAGTVSIADGALLDLTSGGALGGTYSGPGTLQLDGAIAYTVAAASTLAAGQVILSAGATLSGAGTILAPLDVLGTVIATGGPLILDGALTDAGTLTAAAGAVLDLADGGAFFGTVNGAGSVINADAILGASAGLSLSATGTISLTNLSGGEISGGATDGADLTAASVIVTNTGAIGGVRHGVWLTGSAATVTNAGLISGDIGAAILGSGSGPVSIVNTGLIVDYEGVGVAALSLNGAAAATVTNAGTILGGYYLTRGNAAIQFGAGNDRLIVVPGAVFVGTVRGGGGTNTLELAASPTVGTVGTFSGLGTQFQSFTSLVEDAGAAWALSGANTLSTTTTLTLGASASLTVAGALLAVGGASVTGTGTLAIGATGLLDATGGGTVTVGATLANLAGGTLTGGAFEVDAASTLQLAAAVTTDNATIVLGGAGGTIQGRNGAGTQLTLAQSLTTIGAAGTLSVLNNASFATTGTLTDQGVIGLSGGSLGAATLAVGATGTVIGTGAITGTVADAGLVEASGGTLTVSGTVSGAGTIGIDLDSVLYAGGKLGAANIAFLDSGGGLALAQPLTATGTIAGFSTSDSIDLLGSVVTSETLAGGVLTLKGSAGTLATLHFSGDYTGYGFGFFSDGHGGSDIYLV